MLSGFGHSHRENLSETRAKARLQSADITGSAA